LLVASGQPLAAGLASAHALALARWLTQALLVAKLKVVLAVVFLGGGLLAGTCALTRPGWSEAKSATARSPQALAGEPVRTARFGDPRAAGVLGAVNDGYARRRRTIGPPVGATAETTLATAAGQIRQFAFDGDPDTFFASAHNAGRRDHFTLVFDRPVALWSVAVTTGRPQGGQGLDAGTLEVSADGRTFEPLAPFEGGVARGLAHGRAVRAVRVRPGTDLEHPLAVREFAIDSDPPVAVFRYPVEFAVNVDEAPDMRPWAEQAARVCERAYAMLGEELKGDGFTPPHRVTLSLRNRYHGVAVVSDDRITGSAGYFRAHPDDVGALVHVTAYVVQGYHGRGNPSWLVKGIADYLRFFKYEPGKLSPPDPGQARHDGGSQVTAAFLAYLAEQYNPGIVRKLNEALRKGEYREGLFEALTGKSLQELDEEWQASLCRGLALPGGSAGQGVRGTSTGLPSP
jgi:hypothetical protein